MIRVTVVIPTFGRPELLKRAVDSVLSQTVGDMECIVVVDGDDPRTVDYLRGVADSRLRYIVHPQSRGAGQTRDTGADAARGEWVAFLDDDDHWLPEKLERQLAIAPADGGAIIMTLSRVVSPQGETIRPAAPYRGIGTVDEWLFGRTTWLKEGMSFLQTSSLMMPRAMFDHLHFRDTRQHEEWELVIRATRQLGYRLLTVEEPLVIHYVGQPRPSLSKTYTWQRSLAWADGMGSLMTPRGYAGFLLGDVGQSSANTGEYSAILPLLSAAFRRGKPGIRHLVRFGLSFALPRPLRVRVRGMLGRSRPNDGLFR